MTESPPILVDSNGASRINSKLPSLMVQQFIHLAEERIWISSPYLVPDEGVVAALKLAALGGLDVRLLMPSMATVVWPTLQHTTTWTY